MRRAAAKVLRIGAAVFVRDPELLLDLLEAMLDERLHQLRTSAKAAAADANAMREQGLRRGSSVPAAGSVR